MILINIIIFITIMLITEVTAKLNKIRELKQFCRWACKRLNIKNDPIINWEDNLDVVEKNRTFGTTASNGKIWVYVADRNSADIMRTLCHELVHYKQFEVGLASDKMSEEQKQSIEDVANAVAGRLLRDYGKNNVQIYS